MKKFTSGEAISFGWEKMKKNFWFFVGLLFIAWLIQAIPSGISSAIGDKMAPLVFLLAVAAWVIQLIVNMGLIKIILDIVDKGTASLGDLLSQTKFFLNFLAGSILYGLIVIGGLLLLIVPGIVWAIKYQFFSYLIIDKNLGPIEALKKSGEITAGSKGAIFGLDILLILINLLGLLCLVVGLFVTIPLSMVAKGYVFRKLLGETPAPETASAPAETTPTSTEQPA